MRLPGSDKVYRSLGLTLAVQNCVSNRHSPWRSVGDPGVRGAESRSHRNEPDLWAARGHKCRISRLRKAMAFARTRALLIATQSTWPRAGGVARSGSALQK